jgi:uncharacterized protein involved in outer membrane biogenesis
MKKSIKWIALGLVLVIAVGVIIVLRNLNQIIRRTVETQASSSLNVKTALGGVDLSLLGGSLTLNDLRIGSPEGFQAPAMLGLGMAHVDVSYRELTKSPIHIAVVMLDKPHLVIEQRDRRFNFQALMDSQPTTPPAEEGEPLALVIDDLAVTGAVVEILPGVPGLQQAISIAIPDIHIKGIGTTNDAKQGAAIKEAVMEVVMEMAAQASKSDKLPEGARAILAGDLKKVADQYAAAGKQAAAQELNRRVAEALESAGKDNPATKAAQERLGELLGGKKPQPPAAP